MGVGVADQLRAWTEFKAQQQDTDDLFDAENDIFHPSGGGYY